MLTAVLCVQHYTKNVVERNSIQKRIQNNNILCVYEYVCMLVCISWFAHTYSHAYVHIHWHIHKFTTHASLSHMHVYAGTPRRHWTYIRRQLSEYSYSYELIWKNQAEAADTDIHTTNARKFVERARNRSKQDHQLRIINKRLGKQQLTPTRCSWTTTRNDTTHQIKKRETWTLSSAPIRHTTKMKKKKLTKVFSKRRLQVCWFLSTPYSLAISFSHHHITATISRFVRVLFFYFLWFRITKCRIQKLKRQKAICGKKCVLD